MECPRRRNITYKETGEIWFMTVRVMRFLPGMSRYFSSSSRLLIKLARAGHKPDSDINPTFSFDHSSDSSCVDATAWACGRQPDAL